MTTLWLAGGIVILAWGVTLLTNPWGLGGRMFEGLARRQARWQQLNIAKSPVAYRVVFGAFGVLIGSLWIVTFAK